MRSFLRLGVLLGLCAIGTALGSAFRLGLWQRASALPIEAYQYTPTLTCSGRLEAAAMRELYLPAAALPESVAVQVGERVRAGQVLATIDTEQTSAILASGARSVSPAAGLELADADMEMVLAVLASQKGLSAPAGGEVVVPRYLRAPIAGVVMAQSLQSGVLSQRAERAFLIADTSELIVKSAVSERDAARVAVGASASVCFEAVEGARYDARVKSVSPIAEAGGGSAAVAVSLALTEPDERLRLGYSATAMLRLEGSRTLQRIPHSLLLQRADGSEYVLCLPKGADTAIEMTVEVVEEGAGFVGVVPVFGEGCVLPVGLREAGRVRLKREAVR